MYEYQIKEDIAEFTKRITDHSLVKKIVINNRIAQHVNYDILSELPELKELTLEYCNIQFIPDFRKLKSLEILNLSGNLIKTIPDHLLECDSIASINLAYNELTKFPKILLKMKHLCHITILDSFKSYIRYEDTLYFGPNSFFIGLGLTDYIDDSIKKIIIDSDCKEILEFLDNLPNNIESLNIYNLKKPLTNLPSSLINLYIYNTNGNEVRVPYGTDYSFGIEGKKAKG